MQLEAAETLRINTNVAVRPAILLCALLLLWPVRTPAQSAAEAPAQPGIQINVNRVMVPVVVRDARGGAVADLKKEDFAVLDNGRPDVISGFEVLKHPQAGAPSSAAAGAAASSAAGAATNAPVPQQRMIVFLVDDLHLSAEDLAQVQKASAQLFDSALLGTDMAAVVSTSGQTNSGLTRDHAKLQLAMMSLRSRALYRSSGGDCPSLGYYQADLIESNHDGPALQDAVGQVMNCNPGLNPQTDIRVAQTLAESAASRAQTVGRQDAQVTLASIAEYLRRTAKLPGERKMILISSGFLTVDPEALAEESRILDFAAQSNVTISALDARGLYTAELGAAWSRGSVQRQSEYLRRSMTLSEDTMAELAGGTGGEFFHNNNDLSAGLKSLAAAPECVYLLELSPDSVRPDGLYHRLNVKVDRQGLQVQARRGYFMPKTVKNKQ